MPLVVVRFNPYVVVPTGMAGLVGGLPGIVAEAFSGKEVRLTTHDVEVEVQPFGPMDVFARNVRIIVYGGLFPERLANLDERRAAIAKGVRSYLPSGVTGSVWVFLSPASDEEW